MNRSAPWLFLALATALLAPALALAFASDANERQFLWREANALAAQATRPDEFATAAGRYRALAALGARNGPLFYNMGTMLLKAGQPSEAFAAFARAERYMGADADLRRNMRLALGSTTASLREGALPWNRLLFAWHFGLPIRMRALLASVAFAGLWLAAAFRVAGARRAARPLFAACALAFALFGSSAGLTILQEQKDMPPPSLAAPAAP